MGKSHCCFLLAILAAAASQTTIDPIQLLNVFGTPPTSASEGQNFEDITVKPTESPTTFTDQDGQTCKCVPYYLCDDKDIGVDINNASVTGYGELDVRFGEDDQNCQESVEKCCKLPNESKGKPEPDPSKVKGCGYRNPFGLGVTVIGGGNTAQYAEFPWVVGVLDATSGDLVGVGVIIHPQVIMTGAHITSNYSAGQLKIRAGEWDTQTTKEIYDHQERAVQEIYSHADFKPKSLKNDITLLRLEKSLKIAEHVNMLCMPQQDESFDSAKKCVANGWGKDKFGLKGRYAVILKKVEQDMVENGRCNSLMQRTRLGSHFKLHSSFVCAGGEEGKDTCQGDGGAPLACPIPGMKYRYKLSGLVAWGIGCGMKDVPAVYTNVAAFRRWVDSKMNKWGYGTSTYSV